MRNLIITDMHGAYKALMQCIERSGFDPSVDNLICLGDTSDGWPEVRQCFEYLMSLDNIVYCLGNHDEWFCKHLDDTFDVMNGHNERQLWKKQGGNATIKSFSGHPTADVRKFINNAKLYHTIGDKLFCHAGAPSEVGKDDLCDVDRDYYIWDRTMVADARYYAVSSDLAMPEFSEVFVGHTPTLCYGFDTPRQYSNVWLCDTGASYDGKLTIMDANTKEFWQSDPVPSLYPNQKGR